MLHRRLRARLLASGCAMAALAAVAPGSASTQDTGAALASMFAAPGVSVESFGFDPMHRRLVLRDATFARDGVRVTAQRIEVPMRARLLSFVAATTTESSTSSADNIRIERKDVVLTIPHLELRGVSFGKMFAALEPSTGAAPAESPLLKLAFESLTAPDVVVTRAGNADDATERHLTAKNVVISGVAEGKVGHIEAESLRADETTGGTTRVPVELGRVDAENIDVGLGAAIATRARIDEERDLRPLIGSIHLGTVDFSDESGNRVDLGSVDLTGLQARPLVLEPKQLAALGNKPEGDRSEAEKSQLFDALKDALDSSTLDRFELRHVHFASGPGKDPGSFDLDDFAIQALAGLKVGGVSASNFALESHKAKVKFSTFVLNGFDQSGVLDFMVKHQGGKYAAPTPGEMARMIPKLTDMALRDLSITAAAEDGNGNIDEGRQTSVTLPLIESTARRAEGSGVIESSGQVRALYDIVSPAPGSPLDQAKSLGFDHFDLTEDVAGSFDPPHGRLNLAHITLAAKDLMSFTLGSTVSGLSPDMFNGDKAAAAEAARNIRVQAINIGLVNAGLVEKALPIAADANHTTVPALKDSLKDQLGAAATQTFGPGDTATRITTAVDAFIDNPKNLSFTITAPPDGLDVKTLSDAKDPAEIMSHIVVDATANQ